VRALALHTSLETRPMDERRHEPQRADEHTRGESRSNQTERRHTVDRQNEEWRDADQPDGWRHTEGPPLTERERRERWPLG
jgi:hypothetical protein